jgi:hypothetical protein
MGDSGRLLDSQLTKTNGLIARAMVPVAQIISDIGQGKAKSTGSYLGSLINSLRLLAAGFNYLNHTRKEVTRLYVRDSAMNQLYKWDCEVGQDELYPFDVTKRCEEIHKAKKLGSFKQHKRAPQAGYSNKWPRHKGQRSQPPYNTVNNNRSYSANYNSKSHQGKPFLGRKNQPQQWAQQKHKQ